MARRRLAAWQALLSALVLIGLMLHGCVWPGSTVPVVKIGLIAPFEGLGRPVGYEALYAVKLALQEYNQPAEKRPYRVALVALNDNDVPADARQQARMMAVDEDVLGVIGPLSRDTVRSVAVPMAEAGLAWIVPASAPDDVVARENNAYRLFASDADLADAAIAVAVSTEPDAPSTQVVVDPVGDFAEPLRAAAERAGVYAAGDQTAMVEGTRVALGGDAEEVAGRLPTLLGTARAIVAGPEAGRMVVSQRAGRAADGMIWVSSVPPLGAESLPSALVSGYQAMAGKAPDPAAILAYDATRVLLAAIAADNSRNGRPTRPGVVAAISDVKIDGLSGPIAFDNTGSLIGAPIVAYTVKGEDLHGNAQRLTEKR